MKNTLVALATGMLLSICLTGCTPSEVREAQDAIDAIGEVTLDSQDAIVDANAKYDALDEEFKEQVGNYPVLENANAEFNERLKEKECLEAIAAGIEAGWKSSTSNPASFSEQGEAKKVAAEAELDAIREYSSQDFSNEEFGALIENYKKSLQNQIDGLSDYPANPDLYNSQYVENGARLRLDSLKALQDGYALPIGDDYKKRFESELGTSPSRMIPCKSPVYISMPEGDAELTVEGMSLGKGDYSGLVELGIISEGQNVAYLLCTMANISRDAGDDYDDYLRFDEMAIIKGADGVQIDAFDYSGEYPGYTGIGAGVFGVYPDSDIQIGETKRICIPYVIDSSATEVCVQFATGEFSIIPISE